MKLYSMQQICDLTGKAKRTLHNYIDSGKIDCILIDRFRAIPESEIDKINNIQAYRKIPNTLAGYKTINQMARAVNVKPYKLKSYILRFRLEAKKVDNVYYILDETIKLWATIKSPDPNRIEAYQLRAMTIQQAAAKLGYSDGYIRAMAREGRLKSVAGFNRQYITNDSVNRQLEISKLIKEL